MTRRHATLALACLLVLAGCGHGRSSSAPTPPVPVASNLPVGSWDPVTLPAGFQPSLLVATGHSVLVAGDGDDTGKNRPRMLTLTDGKARTIPVAAGSYYAARTLWHGIALDGSALLAFGGRSGGAHGNIRWTAWSGSLTGRVSEDPQDFTTFGGPDEGGLDGVLVPPTGHGGPVIVGSRVDGKHDGLDVALWDRRGRRWVLRPSTGTPLAATAAAQPSAHAAVLRGTGVMIVGAVTEYGAGAPRTVPAVWTAPSTQGPWTRVDLPDGSAGLGEAQAAHCGSDGTCFITGYVGDRLAAWTLTPSGTATRATVPDLPAGPTLAQVAPVVNGAQVVVVLGDPAGGPSAVVVRHGDAYRATSGPAGTVTGLAAVDGTLYLSTRTDAESSLWSLAQ